MGNYERGATRAGADSWRGSCGWRTLPRTPAPRKCVDGMWLIQLYPRAAFRLTDMLPGGFADTSTLRAASPGRRGRLCPVKVSTGGPRSKLAKVAGAAYSVGRIHQFGALRASVNAVRSCDHRLKCVAAGQRCRGSSCEMTGRSHFPRAEDAALA